MTPPPVLKTFEITYLLPDNLVEETAITKSLSFHRFKRLARECHKNLLEFLIQSSLLHNVGGSTLVANERKTFLECTDAVAARVATLPFVETTKECPEERSYRSLAMV